MIDTHTHLQFKAFEGQVDEVIRSANDAGVEKIIVVGTNLETSKRAVELAEKYDGIFASVGIHPHHVFSCHAELVSASSKSNEQPQSWQILKQVQQDDISKLKALISHPKVIAVGETGLDRHVYKNTKYRNYQITKEFIELQKLFFKAQIQLAIKYQKSLIIHNREAITELLEILEDNWDPFLEGRSVFHCCEPDHRLLEFASAHNVFIGIDGDITYDKEKQEFMKQIPLKLLVLETDSPFFTPESLRSAGVVLNEPRNLVTTTAFISDLLNLDKHRLYQITLDNSVRLFNLKTRQLS